MCLYTGLGLGGFTTIGVGSVFLWFNKRRSIALAITLFGIPLGAFVWPPFVTWLVDVYAWRGAFLIVAGIHLQAVVLVCLLRAPDVQYMSINVSYVEKDMKDCDANVDSIEKESQTKDNVRKTSNPDIADSNELETKYENDKLYETTDCEESHHKNSFCEWWVLFKNPSFPLYFLSLFLLNFGHITPFSYTKARGILLGYSEENSAVLASLVGAGSFAGRPLAGIIGGRLGHPGRIYTCSSFLIIAGTLSMLSIASNKYWYLAAYSVLWGFSSGKIIFYFIIHE